jgi:endonuclease G
MVFAFALLPASAAGADRNCTAAERETANRQLWLNTRDKNASLAKHLPWGVPDSTGGHGANEVTLIQRNYVIGYNKALRIPVWTAHKVSKKGLGRVSRVNCFRPEPRVHANDTALTSDYNEPIFDQGHLSPNGDMTSGLNAVINSFVLSNMAPQFCHFNRGVWQILEALTRHWAVEHGEIYVISGSIFDQNGDGARDADTDAKRMKSRNKKTRVAIPTHFYKILVRQFPNGETDTLAFLFPHDQVDLDGDAAARYLESKLVSIDDIEQRAGMNFFPGLEASNPGVATAAEQEKASELWDLPAKIPRSLVASNCRKTTGMVP